MWIVLRLPETGSEPLGKPNCPYCRSTNTRIYEKMIKRVKHPSLTFVSVVRRKCEKCGRTFRHYAPGVNRSVQTATVKALSVLLYSIGLSYGQIVSVLGARGVKLVKSTVWRSVMPVSKKAYYLHTESLKGRVKVKGMPSNLFRTEGRDVLVSIVHDLLEGKGLEIECIEGEGSSAMATTLAHVAKKMGVELVRQREGSVTDNPHDSVDLQRNGYISRLRKSVKRRSRDLTREAECLMKKANGKEKGKIRELISDCNTLRDIVEGKEDSCEQEFWEMYKKYAWAKAPHKGETATLWYKMRLFALRLWDESSRILQQLESSRKN